MSVSDLSASSQNYLKAVWTLQEWSDDPVTLSTLAERAGVRMSTASDAVRRLADQGLLEHTPYGAITLSSRGRAYAVAMVRRHRLIESFLVMTLGYRWDQVHDEAEALEHAVSDFMIDRIDEHLGHPSKDPHGDPIPSVDGEVHRPDATPLTEIAVGARVRVERISDADPELLQYLEEHGVGVGTVLATGEGAPFSDSIEVTIDPSGIALPFGRSATDAVWVTLQE
ncbi:MAG: metal-dependent transcriptional regulator [Leucobacter sp.]